MNQDQIKIEEAVLSLIDLYVREDEKDREYFRKYRKNNPDSGLQKEPFITFYQTFQARVSSHEITDFLYYFGQVRLLKTFYYSHHADHLNERFNKLELPIPHFVLECQREVILREEFIRGYFEKEKYNWSQSQKEGFLSNIQKEAKNHSYDLKGEKDYLKKKFEETIQETRDIEKEIKARFGYLVEGIFEGENFSISKDDLNEYFFHSEIASGGYGSFLEVFKALNKYVSKKNAVFALRSFLSGQYDTSKENKEEIENTFNSMPIEDVRSHFLPLIETKNNSGQNWMTNEDFETFLKRSFGGATDLPKPKINLGTTGKYAVVKLFYLFYEKCIYENLHENRKKDPFIQLLKDSFDTNKYGDIRGDNFKRDRVKHDWK
ncbi:hypothetical protein [Algoriphagus persicinus]|uniref:hypothetical protein n=1 Tax=Algoriphagus persicinus TaxID=3108754 RepID=UPI002B37BA48|nr:hypothetical protein [Algoriphagus sp. E1-3-M2]MEB2785552.1 hypothetical protein [Algoriphagus sp. E1-3-M2]